MQYLILLLNNDQFAQWKHAFVTQQWPHFTVKICFCNLTLTIFRPKTTLCWPTMTCFWCETPHYLTQKWILHCANWSLLANKNRCAHVQHLKMYKQKHIFTVKTTRCKPTKCMFRFANYWLLMYIIRFQVLKLNFLHKT